MYLSEFRSAFIDCQNHAGFYTGAKKLISEFRNFLMDEKCENFSGDDSLTLIISKNKVLFGCNLNGNSFLLILDRKGYNNVVDYTVENLKSALQDVRVTDRVTLFDTINIHQIIDRIAQIYTGENFDIIETF